MSQQRYTPEFKDEAVHLVAGAALQERGFLEAPGSENAASDSR
jgi:hypothetical protein